MFISLQLSERPERFELPTFWFVVGKAGNPKALQVSHLQAAFPSTTCLSWYTNEPLKMGCTPFVAHQHAEATSVRRGACSGEKARAAARLSPFSSPATQFPATCAGAWLFLRRSGHRKIATRRRGLCGDPAWPTMPAHRPAPALRLCAHVPSNVSSKGTRTWSPPRFRIAKSTRVIHKKAPDDLCAQAKKCKRFSHRMPRARINLRHASLTRAADPSVWSRRRQMHSGNSSKLGVNHWYQAT